MLVENPGQLCGRHEKDAKKLKRCKHRYKSGAKKGRRCEEDTSNPSGLCQWHNTITETYKISN